MIGSSTCFMFVICMNASWIQSFAKTLETKTKKSEQQNWSKALLSP